MLLLFLAAEHHIRASTCGAFLLKKYSKLQFFFGIFANVHFFLYFCGGIEIERK